MRRHSSEVINEAPLETSNVVALFQQFALLESDHLLTSKPQLAQTAQLTLSSRLDPLKSLDLVLRQRQSIPTRHPKSPRVNVPMPSLRKPSLRPHRRFIILPWTT